MTAEQFQALAAIGGFALDKASYRAARDVMIGGAHPAEAAKVHGITVEAVYNCLRRMRKTLDRCNAIIWPITWQT